MLSAELDYHLPPELIAQRPVEPRHAARLLCLKRGLQPTEAAISHHTIADLPGLLRPDDLLVFNDTRVLRARLRGYKSSGGRVEALLLREVETNVWEAMLKPSARLKPGSALIFASSDGAHEIAAQPGERCGAGWLLRFEGTDVRSLLPLLGEVPLPPYIAPPAELSGREVEARYQTVYARQDHVAGTALDSAAAPTAGLHFSPELLQALQERGIRHTFVTLGVGAGTFRPIQTERVEEHAMHREEFEISPQTAQQINEQRAKRGRIVAVGTTSVRTLESAVNEAGIVQAGTQATEIFIRPGYEFRVVNALLTNFHLPRSSLLALVAAFAQNGSGATPDAQLTGLETVRYAYEQAIARRYRFFSWGDAMLIE